MFFSLNKLRDLVKTRTKKQVTQGYVFHLAEYLEDYTKKIIKFSEKELEKQNEKRRIQGIYQKQRINEDCLKDIIIFINLNNNGFLPEEAGGAKKVGEKYEMHTQKNQKNQGVEVI